MIAYRLNNFLWPYNGRPSQLLDNEIVQSELGFKIKKYYIYSIYMYIINRYYNRKEYK
jgi:hypothetical protein